MNPDRINNAETVALYGVPSSAGCRPETATIIDQHNGPTALRAAIGNVFDGYDIPLPFTDRGDLSVGEDVPSLLNAVSEVCASHRADGTPFGLLGGTHTLQLGILQGLATTEYSLIYFDAHPDLMPREEITYGSNLYRGVEDGLIDPKRILLIGTRQSETPELSYIAEKGIGNIDMLQLETLGAPKVVEEIRQHYPPPYLLSLDLDALDPAFAPGVTTPFPGGMTSRELFFLVHGIASLGPILGFDLVELCPQQDRVGRTARLAAVLLRETCAAVVKSRS